MNLFTGEAADEYFGGAVPSAVREILHRASVSPRHEVGAMLWTAQAVAPQCLAVYYTLYKHHAGRRELDEAQQAAQRGLEEAARQAGLALDWREVSPASASHIRFSDNGPARFWLFTLKALAFIAVRQQQPEVARALLQRIAELQPNAGMGDDVIRSLLDALGSAPDDPRA
jgi:hypothetical protein